MAIARGSRSSLAWKEEVTYGVAPAGNWNSFPVNSETLDESINTVQGQDIRPDRANPSLRGGNIATGGALVADFGPQRGLTFLKHLLAASVATTPLTVNVPAIADTTAYVLGGWVKASTGVLWQCTQAGTSGSSADGALTGTSEITTGTAKFSPRKGNVAVADTTAYATGDIVTGSNSSRWLCTIGGTTGSGALAALAGTLDVTSGTATFTHLMSALTASKSYKRGDVVSGGSGKLFTCTRGGTTDVSVPTLTAAGETTVVGSGGAILKFQYLGESTLGVWKHVMTAGADWPTGGISIQKDLKGGSQEVFIVFRGCRFDSLELSIPQEGIVRSTWNVLTKDSEKLGSNGAGTPTLVGEAPYTGFNCYVGLNDTVGNVDRAVRDFSMTITNQADAQTFVVGSRNRVDIPEGIRRASGRLSMYFQDATEYDWFKNEVTVSLDASLVWNGKVVNFHFGEVKLTGSGSPKISGAGLLTADFEWTAFLETGTYDVVVTSINDSQYLP